MIIKKMIKMLSKLVLGVCLTFTLLIGKPINAAPTENKLIMLDLAHRDRDYSNSNVIDNGASYKGVNERELVNEITLLLKDKLISKGFNINLTREYDKPISINDRVKKANEKAYDYYISLHANSVELDNSATGIEAYSKNTYTLSNNIIKAISKEFNLTNRKVRVTPYYNKNINSDSTILELGFINNDYDLDIMLNHKDKIADIIANEIDKQYINVKPKKKVYKEIEEVKQIKMLDGTTIETKVTKIVEE